MTSVPPLAQEAIAFARAGDHRAALEKAKAALAGHGGDAGLQLFVGMLHSRLLQLAEALPYFRASVELAPEHPASRLELIRTLIALGELDEGEALLGAGGLPAREQDKLRASLLAQRGTPGAAATIFRQLVTADNRDFESWNQLGACLLCDGRPAEAAAALRKSLELRSEQPLVWDKWVDAMIAAGDGEAALAELGETTTAGTALPAARLLDRLDRPDEALATLQGIAAANPDAVEVIATLAEMLERRNRIDDLARVIRRVEAIAPEFERLPLLKAKLALRNKQFGEARAWAERTSPLVDPGTRLQVIGEAADRIGEHGAAWNAYAEMNREDGRANVGGLDEAENYMRRLRLDIETLDERWASQWRVEPPAPRSPVVLLGFPRSGTTLLDTFLTAHPALCVSEENPLLPALSSAAGPIENLPQMANERIEELRVAYWANAARAVPGLGLNQLVDKYPFGLVAAPYIERLFAAAPILFVQRHPCDVVLSCFFTRFQPSGAPGAFGDLQATARLYDLMMQFWTKSRALLPLRVFDVRYERMVSDTEGEMRAVAAFLNLEWVEGMTENHVAAQGRGFITTPSYAQVSEPVYDRSVERWRNYRGHLDAVLPILEPWVKELGYRL